MAISKGTQYITDPDSIPVNTSTGQQEVSEALDSRGIWVEGLAALKAIDSAGLVANQNAEMTTTGRKGSFTWTAGDQSANVASDPQEGVWVAPDGEDGSSGAWMRNLGNLTVYMIEWFGADASLSNNTSSIQAAIDLAPLGIGARAGSFLSDPVVVPSSKTQFLVMGAGRFETSFADAGNSSSQIFFDFQCSRPFVSGVSFDGDGDGYTSGNGMTGVRIKESGTGANATFITFKDFRLRNWNGNGLEAHFCLDSSFSEYNVFRIGGDGFFVTEGDSGVKDSTTTTVGKGYITNVQGSGVHLDKGSAMRLEYVICEFCGNATDGAAYRFNTTNGVTLYNCYGEANVRNRNFSETNPVEISSTMTAATESDIITYSGTAFEERTGGVTVDQYSITCRYYRPSRGDRVSEVGDEGHPLLEMKPGRAVRMGGFHAAPISVSGALAAASTWEVVYSFPDNGNFGAAGFSPKDRLSGYRLVTRIGEADQNEEFDVGYIIDGNYYSMKGVSSSNIRVVDNGTNHDLELLSTKGVSYGRAYDVVIEQLNTFPDDAGI